MMIRCAKCGADIAEAAWGVAPKGVLCEPCKAIGRKRKKDRNPYYRCTRCGVKGHTRRTCKANDKAVAKVIYNRSKRRMEKAPPADGEEK